MRLVPRVDKESKLQKIRPTVPPFIFDIFLLFNRLTATERDHRE